MPMQLHHPFHSSVSNHKAAVISPYHKKPTSFVQMISNRKPDELKRSEFDFEFPRFDLPILYLLKLQEQKKKNNITCESEMNHNMEILVNQILSKNKLDIVRGEAPLGLPASWLVWNLHLSHLHLLQYWNCKIWSCSRGPKSKERRKKYVYISRSWSPEMQTSRRTRSKGGVTRNHGNSEISSWNLQRLPQIENAKRIWWKRINQKKWNGNLIKTEELKEKRKRKNKKDCWYVSLFYSLWKKEVRRTKGRKKTKSTIEFAEDAEIDLIKPEKPAKKTIKPEGKVPNQKAPTDIRRQQVFTLKGQMGSDSELAKMGDKLINERIRSIALNPTSRPKRLTARLQKVFPPARYAWRSQRKVSRNP